MDYAIGTVSGLTGLDPHTIRAWERRHAAVVPRRSENGRRRYDDADVERLRLLKSATEAGHAIGSVAARPEEELRALLAKHLERRYRPEGPSRVLLRAPELARQIEAHPGSCSWDLLPPGGAASPETDVAIFELGSLGSDPAAEILDVARAAPGATLVVLYTFARRPTLAQLERLGCHLVHAPIRLAALERSIEGWSPAPRPAVPSPFPLTEPVGRHFDDDQLARLLETPGRVACECPSQLATLVRSALDFESYALACEDLTAEDAAIHRQLGTGIARVRSELEQLLAHLCAHEGIRV
jgi:DNA-binding transcriptional MerR regulator